MDAPAPAAIPFSEAVRVWLRVALLSFGGPAGQIAVMHRILVEETRWVSERRFLHALNYCMLLPGPEAQQLTVYVGWLLHGVRGGLVAGWLFVAPGFVSILGLSIAYAGFHDLHLVQGLFFGIKAAVLAIVAQAVVRIGRRVLRGAVHYALAAGAFVSLFVFDVPFPVVIASAAAIGLVRAAAGVQEVFGHAGDDVPTGGDQAGLADTMAERAAHTRPSLGRAARVTFTGLTLWLTPTLALLALLGPDHVFSQIAVFFSKMAVVTFGGAYAVLAYVAQQGVEHYGWLQPGEMIDGLGMAETTPGPLIQVVQFVAFMAAFRDAGALGPYTAAVFASVLATWVTFAPCFLWILLGGPYAESLRHNAWANGALSAITAAVVGVILNLVVWFAMHALFGQVETWRVPGGAVSVPVWRTLDGASLGLAGGALLALLGPRAGMLSTLATTAAVGALWHLLMRA